MPSEELWRDILQALAAERGAQLKLDLAWIRELCDGRQTCSQAFARFAERRWGIDPSRWPNIEPAWQAGAARRQARKLRTAEDMHAQSGRQPEEPDHPLFVALRKRKLSLRGWCAKTKRKTATVSAWARGFRGIPEDEAERINRELDGEVPPSSWHRRQPPTA